MHRYKLSTRQATLRAFVQYGHFNVAKKIMRDFTLAELPELLLDPSERVRKLANRRFKQLMGRKGLRY